MLKQIIRTAVISALGAKLAKGRSPLVAALVMLLATRMLAGREESGRPSRLHLAKADSMNWSRSSGKGDSRTSSNRGLAPVRIST
jgi:hypothetical protein